MNLGCVCVVLSPDGDSTARGKGGEFKPNSVWVYPHHDGVRLEINSAQVGNEPPIRIVLSAKDWLRVVDTVADIIQEMEGA